MFAAVTVILVLGALEAVAQVVWRWLEARAFARTTSRGEAILRNDAINFMKVADGRFGYVLKRGVSRGGVVVNAQGFVQREAVAVERGRGVLRVIAMGESTTQGHDVDSGNYPVYLQRVLKASVPGFSDAEVINAGVAGWVSDQLALRAELELAAYKPDIVLLYVGWNDFQSYDPLAPAPRKSYFETAYAARRVSDRLGLRSVELLSSAVAALETRFWRHAGGRSNGERPPRATETYRFFLASLDRIVRAFRASDPGVRLAISTLVGRWPQGTLEEFAERANGRTWWMTQHALTPAQAAASLERFNQLVRDHARAHDLLLIDAAKAFSGLDRGSLQWDFAHMHAEGYELLAEIMYRSLAEAGVLEGGRSGRLEELARKYGLRER